MSMPLQFEPHENTVLRHTTNSAVDRQ